MIPNGKTQSQTYTSQLIRLAWPVLVAQLAIMATVQVTLISVLFALPAIIAHLCGAGRSAQAG